MTDDERARQLDGIFQRLTGVGDPAASDFAWALITHPQDFMDALVDGGALERGSVELGGIRGIVDRTEWEPDPDGEYYRIARPSAPEAG